MDMLHVFCRRPGLIRGGRPHSAHTSYGPGIFTRDQLAEMEAEPEITLIVGRVAAKQDLAAFAAGAETKKGGK